jgi:UDP-N-acetylmuramyl pentapeptide synthase
MGEVGAQGPAFHAEVGRRARDSGITHLWCAGMASAEAAHAYGGGARHFATVESLLESLQFPGAADAFPRAAAILVKGSRFMAMERVVAALRTAGGSAARGES